MKRESDGIGSNKKKNYAPRFSFLIVVLAAYGLVGCSAVAATAERKIISIAASPASYPFLSRLANAFNQSYPEKERIFIDNVPTTNLASKLTDHSADATVQFVEPSSLQWTASLGWAAMGIWVNPANTVSDLSFSDLEKIFHGTTGNWNQLGGEDHVIQVYSFGSDTDIASAFTSQILHREFISTTAILVPSPEAFAEAIAHDPGGIGFLMCSEMRPDIKMIPVQGAKPSYAHLQSAEYPLRFPLLLSAPAKPAGTLAEFIGWAQSYEGQKVLYPLCTEGN